MSLRLKFILYLIFIHLLFAGVAIYLHSTNRAWLLAEAQIVSLLGRRRVKRQSSQFLDFTAPFVYAFSRPSLRAGELI